MEESGRLEGMLTLCPDITQVNYHVAVDKSADRQGHAGYPRSRIRSPSHCSTWAGESVAGCGSPNRLHKKRFIEPGLSRRFATVMSKGAGWDGDASCIHNLWQSHLVSNEGPYVGRLEDGQG
jgi:hypothetical protein